MCFSFVSVYHSDFVVNSSRTSGSSSTVLPSDSSKGLDETHTCSASGHRKLAFPAPVSEILDVLEDHRAARLQFTHGRRRFHLLIQMYA